MVRGRGVRSSMKTMKATSSAQLWANT
jgi:hypothetical protein